MYTNIYLEYYLITFVLNRLIECNDFQLKITTH